ncbi:MAG TPA: replication-associated recombination protein A [Planctomycetota bacterium]|nr:replication-associated recombination protein A [Planctomycetota bacterium]
MSDLFGSEPEPRARATTSKAAPLADRMRPRTLAEFVGQDQLLGEGKILERAAVGDISQSLILWGPPGSGKTTLARLLAAASSMRFVPFSAVLSGIKEVREVMSEAERNFARGGGRTLLFVDEIHRFNKSQQDAFLPFLERGEILLIGATTENPSFELNSALLSRARVLILEPHRPETLVKLLRTAVEDPERGLGNRVQIDDACLLRMAHASDGDARRALNLLETAAGLVPDGATITDNVLATAIQTKVLAHDKAGEEHYNLISALHKSVRNSDDNATLYWLARLLRGGEDGKYVSRRLIRMAVEDIGLADPFALRVTLDAADVFHRLGSPEGDLALAQAAVYLARTKKSNAVYVAYGKAVEDVERTMAEPVPLHLRNAPTKLMKQAGYGAGYRYAPDDPDAVKEMVCLPPSLADRRYFKPRE